jgi:hypothetical protein
MVLINCWIQLCSMKGKCPQSRACTTEPHNSHPVKKKVPNSRNGADTGAAVEYYTFKDVSLRLLIEDPYGMQHFSSHPGKVDILPNVIGTYIEITSE